MVELLHQQGQVLRVPVLVHAVAQDVDARNGVVEVGALHDFPVGVLILAHAQVRILDLARQLVEGLHISEVDVPLLLVLRNRTVFGLHDRLLILVYHRDIRRTSSSGHRHHGRLPICICVSDLPRFDRIPAPIYHGSDCTVCHLNGNRISICIYRLLQDCISGPIFQRKCDFIIGSILHAHFCGSLLYLVRTCQLAVVIQHPIACGLCRQRIQLFIRLRHEILRNPGCRVQLPPI